MLKVVLQIIIPAVLLIIKPAVLLIIKPVVLQIIKPTENNILKMTFHLNWKNETDENVHSHQHLNLFYSKH